NIDLDAEEREVFRDYQAQVQAAGNPWEAPIIAGEVTGLADSDGNRRFPPERLREAAAGKKEIAYPAVLLALHRATGRTVVADYFTKPQRLPTPERPGRLGELVRAACRIFGRDCIQTGAILRFRSVT